MPATDEDDRRRWNVYPLLGAPYEEFDWDNPEGLQRPEQLLTSDPRVPPPPFAKAPAVVQRDAEQAAPEGSGPGQDESPAPAGSPVPSPEPTAAP